MYTFNEITLRALDIKDLDTFYIWESDVELSLMAGWMGLVSPAAFKQRQEARIFSPPSDLRTFAIDYKKQFVGTVQLAHIDYTERRAMIGIVIGAKEVWGKGIGSAALRILLDYAFTVQNLERIQADAYGFNVRSQRLMERVGFQKEGILRQHEIHNGERQDLHIYGMLKAEFYEKYETIFKLKQ